MRDVCSRRHTRFCLERTLNRLNVWFSTGGALKVEVSQRNPVSRCSSRVVLVWEKGEPVKMLKTGPSTVELAYHLFRGLIVTLGDGNK